MREKFLATKKRIDEAKNILLVGHIEPDGDALGSMLGLKIALENIGKRPDTLCVSNIPKNLLLLPGIKKTKQKINADYDLTIGLDYGDRNRLETIFFDLPAPLPEVTFDHHPYTNQSGDFGMIDTQASSSCEIVYKFLNACGLEVNKEAATCLLSGIFADTWNLRHPNASAETFVIAGQLLAKGAPLNTIVKISNQGNILVKKKAWGESLAGIKYDQDAGMIYSFLNYSELARHNIDYRDLSGLSSFISAVPEAKFSLVLTEIEPGRLDGSLRALPGKNIDVSRIAKALGGGGHKLSAGFKTNLKPDDVFETIRELMKCG